MGVLIAISCIFVVPCIGEMKYKILFALIILFIEVYVINSQIKSLYIYKKEQQLKCKNTPMDVIYYYEKENPNEKNMKKIVLRLSFRREKKLIKILKYSLTDYPVYIANILWNIRDRQENIYFNNSIIEDEGNLRDCCAEIITNVKPISLEYRVDDAVTKSVVIDKKALYIVFESKMQNYIDNMFCNKLGIQKLELF